ncbi:LexA repressor [Actinoplanes sp. SE50]|uniref:LexA family protein n=1 Tax=unclassified Actinoplanes TaxID=2626549 RepID=UPI00023ED2CB|nr:MULTISPECIES: MarR family transcriptional regulator [unclassified Actinoplanes]AEV86693.1 LexA repressor [Actinoplanes sp. SE50/110]ATO85091.1 LexA repressor [Actinoplanes sp. SE50]SLM02502.1 LexA repressor [Actinoplanes sp. SE50/110]
MSAKVVPLLSGTQQRILTFIQSYAAEKQFPPTMKEIGAGVHLSPSAVAHQLIRLQGAGWISRVPNTPRAIRVLDPETGGD